MVGHGRPWVRVCVCGACAPPTPTNTILLYLHDTHQTSPQPFPLNPAGPLKLARPSAHSRASMSAYEATGPRSSSGTMFGTYTRIPHTRLCIAVSLHLKAPLPTSHLPREALPKSVGKPVLTETMSLAAAKSKFAPKPTATS